MTSWVAGAADSGFDADHLPYGIFTTPRTGPRVGVRIGEQVLDATGLAAQQDRPWAPLLASSTLNRFMAAGPSAWAEVRAWLGDSLTEPGDQTAVQPFLQPLADVTPRMPFAVGDFVDFYASEHHASNLGRLFRPDSEPLLPNWKHLPVGYHGRGGTVVPSGTVIRRPSGQRKNPDAARPVFGPTQRLDIEAEIGFVVGVPSTLGRPIPATAFDQHVFGVGLVNDWSARDIQAWEYVPLGPFLGKSFATSISRWITPLAALDSARVAPPERTEQLLPYLQEEQDWGLDISMSVLWNGTEVSRPPFASTYWTGAQMLAHLSVNGASVRTGDLFASGTVSGEAPDTVGSFIELTKSGREPVALQDGSMRTFLADGDTVTIRATAPSTGGGRIEFGEVSGTVLAAG